jgi:hypothetical protein
MGSFDPIFAWLATERVAERLPTAKNAPGGAIIMVFLLIEGEPCKTS